MAGSGVEKGSGSARIVLLGPPGAGKGTQCKLLERRMELPQISTGDILRGAVRKGTALGREAKKYMDRGTLVPDEVMVGIVEERLARKDCRHGFLLDGFPRTVPQMKALERILEKLDVRLDAAVSLEVPKEELVRRLSGRRTCRECGKMYHTEFEPPTQTGFCDQCGGKLYQRVDDSEETIRARLDVYARQTAPVYEEFARAGVLRHVDGTGGTEEVYGRILEGLGHPG